MLFPYPWQPGSLTLPGWPLGPRWPGTFPHPGFQGPWDLDIREEEAFGRYSIQPAPFAPAAPNRLPIGYY